MPVTVGSVMRPSCRLALGCPGQTKRRPLARSARNLPHVKPVTALGVGRQSSYRALSESSCLAVHDRSYPSGLPQLSRNGLVRHHPTSRAAAAACGGEELPRPPTRWCRPAVTARTINTGRPAEHGGTLTGVVVNIELWVQAQPDGMASVAARIAIATTEVEVGAQPAGRLEAGQQAGQARGRA